MIQTPGDRVGKIVNLIRHAQSAANIGDFYQASDSELTEEGLVQARLLGARLIHFAPDILVSSPYLRAKQTADQVVDVISELTDESYGFHVNELYRERDKPSSIDNKPYSDEVASATYARWEESLTSSGVQVEDGENNGMLIERADQALDYLLQLQERRIAVFSHGNFIRAIIGRVVLKDLLTPQSLQIIQGTMLINNTGITTIRFSEPAWGEAGPSWKLETYNDHAHLDDA